MKRFNSSQNKLYRIFSLIYGAVIVLSASPLSAASSEKKWIVAAEKFSITRNTEEVDSVKSSVQEMLPERIVENLSSSSYRTILSDEELDRTLYSLKNERISLFLQLSSAVRTRDAVFLNNYSDRQLKAALKDEEKKINEIQKKIDDNLLLQKEAEEKAQKKSALIAETSDKT